MNRFFSLNTPAAAPSRRAFLKTSATAAGAGAALSACARDEPEAAASDGLPLTIAGYAFDRVEALASGKVRVEGCNAEFEVSSIGEMNTHIFSGPQTREVTEVGLHPFMLAYANEGFRDYTLLPIFPLRVFRHKSIFIRTDRGINRPEDLRGKTIATPGYSSTSLTWIRGILQEHYGVRPEDIEWVAAAGNSAAALSGKQSEQEQVLPEGIRVTRGPAGKDESDLLESGEVDALFHAAEPRAFVEGKPNVGRLFPDPRKAERAYFAKTGIFPIMHAVAIRKDFLEQNPWVAEAVFNAYSEAKQIMYKKTSQAAWAMVSLPWFSQEAAETRKLMGDNFWPYGIEPNRKAIEALCRYSHEQGLASRELTIEELFHPASLELAEKSA